MLIDIPEGIQRLERLDEDHALEEPMVAWGSQDRLDAY